MITSQTGIDLIKKFEGWRAKAYRDPIGVWTIGYGHTAMAGMPRPAPGMKITKAEGEQILRNDLVKYEIAVNEALRVEVNQNQFDALVSFTYNVGPGNLRKSSVLSRTNEQRFGDVPFRLLQWNKAGGKVLSGLTRRRKAEGALYATPMGSTAPLPDVQATQRTLVSLLLKLWKAFQFWMDGRRGKYKKPWNRKK